MPVSFLLEEFPDDALDQILSLTPSGKTQYFTKLAIASSFAIVTLALIKVINFDAYNFESGFFNN